MTAASRALVDAITTPAGLAELADSPPGTAARVWDLIRIERLAPVIGSAAVAAGLTPPVPLSVARFVAGSGLGFSDRMGSCAAAYALNTARTGSFSHQLAIISAALDEQRIPWVPLKGAAMLLDRIWPDPAAREMTDLDLLIPDANRALDAQRALTQIGYLPVENKVASLLPDEHHLTPLSRLGEAGSVELHTALVADWDDHLFPTQAVRAGIRTRNGGLRLDPADMVRHLIVHARISDQTLITGELRLRSVLDVGYHLAQDWSLAGRLHKPDDDRQVRRAIHDHLAAVEDVFGINLGVPAPARLWWKRSMWLAAGQRRSTLWRRARLAPGFLTRARMEARAGRPLRGFDRVSFSVTAVRDRLHDDQ